MHSFLERLTYIDRSARWELSLESREPLTISAEESPLRVSASFSAASGFVYLNGEHMIKFVMTVYNVIYFKCEGKKVRRELTGASSHRTTEFTNNRQQTRVDK